MKSNWTMWPLIACALLLLVLPSRIDLLVIVTPLAGIVGYSVSALRRATPFRERKI